MKNAILKLSLVGCIAIAMTTNCTSSPEQKAEKVEEAQEKLDKAKADLAQARQDSINNFEKFKAECNAKLADNEAEIARLRAKDKADKKEEREAFEKELNELESKNAKLKSDMNEYNNDDANKWDVFKTEFKRDMDAVGESISKLAKKI